MNVGVHYCSFGDQFIYNEKESLPFLKVFIKTPIFKAIVSFRLLRWNYEFLFDSSTVSINANSVVLTSFLKHVAAVIINTMLLVSNEFIASDICSHE